MTHAMQSLNNLKLNMHCISHITLHQHIYLIVPGESPPARAPHVSHLCLVSVVTCSIKLKKRSTPLNSTQLLPDLICPLLLQLWTPTARMRALCRLLLGLLIHRPGGRQLLLLLLLLLLRRRQRDIQLEAARQHPVTEPHGPPQRKLGQPATGAGAVTRGRGGVGRAMMLACCSRRRFCVLALGSSLRSSAIGL